MTKRREHVLKAPKQKTKPEHLIFVDTETTQHKGTNETLQHKLMLGVAYYVRIRRDGYPNNKSVHRFEDCSEFWALVDSVSHSKSVLYLLSHNAVFDFTVLGHIPGLEGLGYRCEFVFDNQMTFISKWTRPKHTIYILNTANWFVGSVDKWGATMDVPKLTMPKYEDPLEDWYTYCQRDVEILYRLTMWYLDFLETHDLGAWKYTIASSAFYSFRYRFMEHNITIPDDKTETRLSRESYKGGRTEVFQVGDFDNGPFYKLDVNSMYPFVMMTKPYPAKLAGTTQELTVLELAEAMKRYLVIADVELETEEPFYPVTWDGRNIYPVGWLRGTFTTGELSRALERGWLRKVHSCAFYYPRPIFKAYVEYFYGLKVKYGQEGQPLLKQFTKLYLNSLYGKFGQRGYEDAVLGETEEPGCKVSFGINARTGERYLVRQVGRRVLYSKKSGEGYNSFVAIASHVTGYARMYLYDLINMADRSNVYYCDTDSVIVNEEGLYNLEGVIDDSSLGALKCEGVSQSLQIVAPKHYVFDGKVTMKGIRKDAQALGNLTYRQEVWPGFNSIMKGGGNTYFNYFVTKTLSPEIKTGNVLESGIVVPIRMESEKQ